MYGGVIKVHNMFEVNNKAPVCLKKNCFGEAFPTSNSYYE